MLRWGNHLLHHRWYRSCHFVNPVYQSNHGEFKRNSDGCAYFLLQWNKSQARQFKRKEPSDPGGGIDDCVWFKRGLDVLL